MKQVSQHVKSGAILVEEVPTPAMKPGHLLVQTHYSVISPGTERASVSSRSGSLLSKARKNPDLVKKILEQVVQLGLVTTYKRVQSRLESLASLGYSASGEVVAVGKGIDDLAVGTPVACAGAGYASHAEYLLIPRNLCAKIPRGVGFDEAAYTTIGAIALQGVRQAAPTLGESVAVVGLGLVGQLTVQLLKAHGCVVIGIDLDRQAVELAKNSGADVAVGRSSADIKRVVQSFTMGKGVDAVIITAATTSNDPIQLSGEICREKGRVVLVGDVGLQLPRGPYYMKELDFRLSRSYGPGRYDPAYEEGGKDYPFGYVRWTENRNMQEFLRLLSTKEVDVQKLTTHRFTIDEAAKAYTLISGSRKGRLERSVGVLLDYEATHVRGDRIVTRIDLVPPVTGAHPNPLNIGFLGAGSFAQASLLPPIKSHPGISLVGVCTGNGLNAKSVAKNFKFQFATTNPKDVIDNESIGTVFIATRHNLHAGYIIDAIKRGKNVFVEKPLAVNEQELAEIVKSYQVAARSKNHGVLMVGFNRNFAPSVRTAKEFFSEATGPFVINYRVNAGYLPSTHWTRDPEEGGGRIVGEVCHFVALIQHFVNASPDRVYAEGLSIVGTMSGEDDSTIITLRFSDGSIGTIMYLANADPSVPKEYIEISSTGRTAIIDNFQRLKLFRQEKLTETSSGTIQKGHREEIEAFLSAIKDGKESPMSFESLVMTTRITFKVQEALRKGMPVSL
jgi:predicted dehydrogenase/threonine dehydrogenase-like Zn-dependent dehydrogenase